MTVGRLPIVFPMNIFKANIPTIREANPPGGAWFDQPQQEVVFRLSWWIDYDCSWFMFLVIRLPFGLFGNDKKFEEEDLDPLLRFAKHP